jgi:hypothetical protein
VLHPPGTPPESPRARLQWALSLTTAYGGPASPSTGEAVFSALPALTEALDWAVREGDPEDIVMALPVADVLGAAWEQADLVIAELLRRTQESGDPLLQAMGLNRAGWGAFGQGEHEVAQQRYERAWALADLHEDPVVEARTAAGLGLLAMLRDETEQSGRFWRRALELADLVHDRGFTLHCLDGVAALLVLSQRDQDGARLSAAASAVRNSLRHGREEAMLPLHDLVLRHSAEPVETWSYAEAVAFARRVVGASG